MPAEILTLFEINAYILLGGAISVTFISFVFLRPYRSVFLFMALVPAVAALAYTLMSLGVGLVQTTDGVANVARYADWLITTPLLLYILSYVSISNYKQRIKTFLILTVADVVMLLTGIGSEFFVGNVKVILFTLSMLAYIGMLYIVIDLMIGLNKLDLSSKKNSIALTMAWIILILWSVYPFIWVFGTQGVAAIGLEVETIAYMLLDVLTKLGFASLLLWYLYLPGKKSDS